MWLAGQADGETMFEVSLGVCSRSLSDPRKCLDSCTTPGPCGFRLRTKVKSIPPPSILRVAVELNLGISSTTKNVVHGQGILEFSSKCQLINTQV